jgi:hypothetical protein
MSGNSVRYLFFAGLALGAMLGAVTTVMGETRIAGWIERVRLGDEGIVVSAKLDTGALTSSLHAADVRWFTRDGEEWVAFEVTEEGGRTVRFERKVVRVARIKRQGADSQRRPTVVIGVCLGGVYRVTEVNLTDRTGFKYEFLVGRRFLAGHFLVDSARTNTVAPDCPGMRKQ